MFKRPKTNPDSLRNGLKIVPLNEVKSQPERAGSRDDRRTPDREREGPAMAVKKPRRDPKPGPAAQPARSRSGPKPMTASRINNITEYYLQQREACTGMIRDMLNRRAYQWLASMEPEDRASSEAQLTADIESCIQQKVEQGLVCDRRYAEMKARSWRSSGRGAHRIRIDLQKKGISPHDIEDAIRAADEDIILTDDLDTEHLRIEGERVAADALARRKKIGKFRDPSRPIKKEDRHKVWRREAGVLARAGFSMDVIHEILNGQPDEDED